MKKLLQGFRVQGSGFGRVNGFTETRKLRTVSLALLFTFYFLPFLLLTGQTCRLLKSPRLGKVPKSS
jgi:hypothetical protein